VLLAASAGVASLAVGAKGVDSGWGGATGVSVALLDTALDCSKPGARLGRPSELGADPTAAGRSEPGARLGRDSELWPVLLLGFSRLGARLGRTEPTLLAIETGAFELGAIEAGLAEGGAECELGGGALGCPELTPLSGLSKTGPFSAGSASSSLPQPTSMSSVGGISD
jgi:hypothetical protein